MKAACRIQLTDCTYKIGVTQVRLVTSSGVPGRTKRHQCHYLIHLSTACGVAFHLLRIHITEVLAASG